MNSPLADRLRPRTLDEVCGQRHLLAPGCVFRRAVSGPRVPNMIFYGPPGVGKTTVARILAKNSGMLLHQLNGTSAGTADIKSVLADVGTFGAHSGVLLYLDEIQYLNKKQQQSLLECLEAVSYTHLDVYKRQPQQCPAPKSPCSAQPRPRRPQPPAAQAARKAARPQGHMPP